MTDNLHRLPSHVVPNRYDIQLTPDLVAHTFTGTVSIYIDVLEPTSEVVLNAAELVIASASFLNTEGVAAKASAAIDDDLERLTLTLDQPLAPGPWTLTIAFSGILNDELRGFYRASFTDAAGVEQWIATTQFEATHARRAFPCWDEPAFKAVFGVTLTYPDDLFAVSNSAEISRSEADGWATVKYADTMKMSTYLVAFVVGPLEATGAIDVDGVPLRVIAPRGKLHLAPFALEAGAFCLRWLTKYYGVPYPGDKVDFIAVPDFAFGAMENLGAIIYRETALLLDPETTALSEQRRVVDVIAHELAHMWFGDLVTMQWWEGIWLNEAFASFMEMKATDAMHPEWERWLAFAADPGAERSDALTVDALKSSRPVEFAVGAPEEADEMFDALTYGKGAAVLRMLEQFIGVEVFRDGVADYLRTHAYSNTVTADLWAALERASGMHIGEIMNTWILQAGHPRIDVSFAGNRVSLAQRPMHLTPDDTDMSMWRVPMQIKASVGGAVTTFKLLLDTSEHEMEFDGEVEWVIANAGGHGFYRVNYSDAALRALMTEIDHQDPLERITVLDDARALVVSGYASITSYLDLCGQFTHERQQAIWQNMIGGLRDLRQIVPDDLLPAFEERVRSLVRPQADNYGWSPKPDESDLENSLRGDLIRALGTIGSDPDTVARAKPLGRQLLADPRSIDPVVGQASLFVLAAHGDDDDFAAVRAAYDSAPTPQLRQRYLQALAAFDGESFVAQVFEWTLDGTVRGQDAAWLVARMCGNRTAGTEVWRLIRTRWPEIEEAYPALTVKHLFDGLVWLSDPATAADVDAFFAESDMLASKPLMQTLEILHGNVALRQRETAALQAAFGS